MRTRDRSLLANAASLLLCGLLAGLVVAAAAFPAIAMSGLGAKAAADTFEALPRDIDVPTPPQISYVYASDRKTLLAMLYDENRRAVTLDEVSTVMQQAMVAAEDNRFYDHRGVDLHGVGRAFVANQQSPGKVTQGASTLTMQLVRQLIAYSARTPKEVIEATEQTPRRKIQEIRYAIELEKKHSKEWILETYLNIAAFGQGAYGIFAASQVYFGKPPKDLTLPEAAIIAGLVKAPTDYNPATEEGKPRALERRGYVLSQMVEMGFISQTQRDEANATDLAVSGVRTPEGCSEVQRPELGSGFFCDYLIRWWLNQPAFGADRYERENRLRSGGYTIISSLNIATQTAAHKYALQQPGVGSSGQIKLGDSRGMMLAAIEPGTGRVEAIAMNRTFNNDQSQNGANTNPGKKGQKGNWPNTTVPFITGGDGIPGYQAGSVYKIFTVVAALEKGYPLEYTINATSPYKSAKYRDAKNAPGTCPGTNIYCPKNASASMNGVHTMWGAFGRSVNTYFVPLQERVGAASVIDVSKRLGLEYPNPGDLANKNPDMYGPFTLGVSETTPLHMANAWATLAADGMYCEPIPVVEIRDLDNTVVEAGDPRCKSVISPEVARGAIDVGRCPVGDRSSTSKCTGATAGSVRNIVGRPISGKTGTTDSERSATFSATTKNLAVSGFLTDPDWPQTNRKMQHPPVNNAVAYTLRDGMASKEKQDFTPPGKGQTTGVQVNIPNVRCNSVDEAKRKIKAQGFEPDVSDATVPSECRAGLVAGTTPSGKTIKGGVVVIYRSNGEKAPSTPPRAPSGCLLPFAICNDRD